ncbi:MAG: nucleotidyltransferase family protein [Acidobacteria bacterium]|nr:nucleotidyltransferase family protein [Acidobacteriota bacterium]
MNTLEGVVLAAGKSTRTSHQYKMELDLGGQPVIRRSVESLLPVCRRVIVVGGHNYDRLCRLVADCGGVETVCNHQYERGMFSSVCCGIRQVRGDAFFLLPGDIPLVRPETVRRMAAVAADIVVPRHEGRKGHPVLVHARFIPEILAMPADATLRDFMHRQEITVLDVTDHGIVMDIDDLDDYEAARAYCHSRE